MTPLGCAEGIVDFIKERLEANDELTNSGEKQYKVYTGFLTIGMSRSEIKDLAPAIIVRPTEVTDGEQETVAVIGIYITDYDEDRVEGCKTLFHIMEFLRFELLTNNPIRMKYNIKSGSMISSLPDEQPYPQWWGSIHFEVNLPQPKRNFSEVFQ